MIAPTPFEFIADSADLHQVAVQDEGKHPSASPLDWKFHDTRSRLVEIILMEPVGLEKSDGKEPTEDVDAIR